MPRSSEAVQRTLTNKLLEKRAELLLFKLDMVHDFGRVIFEARDEGVLIAKGVIGGEEKKKTLLRALEKMNDVQKIEDHVKVGILSHLIF
jgi:hypothetical protein